MRFKALTFFSLILLVLTVPGPAPAVEATPVPAAPKQKVYNAETFTLTNGMRVVVIPNPRAPVVTHMVWYMVGAADEVPGKTGLAHLLEHLMFKGSANVPPGEFSRRVRAMGGNDNAFTSQDYTAYHQNIARTRLRDVMMMEADRMRGITLPPEEFLSERNVVIEERRQNIENDPHAYFFEKLRYSLFPNHPYSTPVIGWKSDIEMLTREDALDFHRTWYAPNNAILVVGGDITAVELRPMAEEIYGSIPARETSRTVFHNPAPLPGQARYVLRDPRIKQPMIVWMATAPGYMESKQDARALQILMEAVGGSAATRLYQNLVVAEKIATSADIGYSGMVRHRGTISASLSLADGVPPEEAEKRFLNLIETIANAGITDSELAEAKTRLKDSADFARDSLTRPANTIGAALAIGVPIEDVEYWPYDIDAITRDQVNDVARRMFGSSRSWLTAYILPAEDAAP